MPTFRTGQLLYVQPDVRNLVSGDVIIYSNPSRGNLVVHRIVVVTPTGLITRGDHNLLYDELRVSLEQVVGRVDAVEYSGVIRNVVGGQLGQRIAQVRWVFLKIFTKLRYFIGAPYRALKNSPKIRDWFKEVIKLQFEYITLRTVQGPMIKALYHGRVVARWKSELPRFECRKPYDLWLEEGDFPISGNKQNSQNHFELIIK